MSLQDQSYTGYLQHTMLHAMGFSQAIRMVKKGPRGKVKRVDSRKGRTSKSFSCGGIEGSLCRYEITTIIIIRCNSREQHVTDWAVVSYVDFI